MGVIVKNKVARFLMDHGVYIELPGNNHTVKIKLVHFRLH